jgi:internalin A
LSRLTSLDLSRNGIQRTSLDLADNDIGAEGAKAIAEHLPRLTSLNLWGNRIGAEGAKAIAEHLPQLTSLDLSRNGIGAEGAKAIAEHLPQLTSLDLADNRIGAKGAKAMLDKFLALGSRRRLRTLNLRGNGERNGETWFPKEVIEVTDADALLAAYESFRRSAEARNLFPLNEAKLLIVGNEAVGKTSLVRFLVDGRPCDEHEKRTSGVAKRSWTPQQTSIRLNIWDFAGQEITRGTHQYFLTERSLYLIVLEDRRQDDQSICEWLKIVLNRGKNSPIIVVINKSDNGKQELALPEEKLKKDYPQIVTFLRTSCKADEWSKHSIKELQQTIVKTLAKAPELKPIRDKVPGGWLRVKENIARDAERQSVLELSDFIRLCEQNPKPGETPGDPIRTEAEQRALLRVLHELGTIVAHGLSDIAMLPTVHILDPNWLTQGIYTILEHHVLHKRQGEFSRDQLKDWLPAEKYSPKFFDFILSMMQDDEIELCFPLEARGKGWFLVPEALPVEGPASSALAFP